MYALIVLVGLVALWICLPNMQCRRDWNYATLLMAADRLRSQLGGREEGLRVYHNYARVSPFRSDFPMIIVAARRESIVSVSAKVCELVEQSEDLVFIQSTHSTEDWEDLWRKTGRIPVTVKPYDQQSQGIGVTSSLRAKQDGSATNAAPTKP